LYNEADLEEQHYEPFPLHETSPTGIPLTLVFNRLNTANTNNTIPHVAAPTATTTTTTEAASAANRTSEHLPKKKGL
jgi:hypothetical protein